MADAIVSLPAGLPADFTLLSTLLDLLPLGVIYYTPVVDAAGTLTDLALAYLNPAAQRMTRLPAQPGTTYRQQFPTTDANGAWDFHRRSWLGQEPQQFQFYYDADGFDSYFRVTAQRLGEGLLAIFTDTQDEGRSQAEQALRESQAREQKARAEAERQRANLVRVFERASVAIGLFRGPDHLIELANEEIGQILNRPVAPLVGRPIFEAAPDLREQGLETLMDSTFRDGTPFDLREVPVQIQRAGSARPTQGYFNITYRPQYDGYGQRSGVVCLAVEVTDQVEARQRVEQLNQELEARVLARTRQLSEQQELLGQVLGRVPAAVATFHGPDHRFTFFNAQYQQLAHGRAALGLAMAEVIPEATAQGFVGLLDQVYQTGQPFVGNALPIALKQPDGTATEHYFNFVFQPLQDTANQITDVLAFAVEVSEQVRARQQNETLQAGLLAAAQQQVRARDELYQVFEQAPVIVALLRGPEHFFHYCNPAFQALFPNRTLTGQLYAAALPEIVAAGLMPVLDQVYATGQPYYGRALPVVTSSPDQAAPDQHYFDFSYHPYREDDCTVGISIFAYDVTAQVLARREREAQQQQLAQIFAHAPVAIAILQGPQYRVELSNAALAALWGRTPAQALGRPLFELVPEAAGQGFEQLLDQALATGNVFTASELPSFIERDGRRDTAYWSFVYAPLLEPDGTIDRLMVVATEVTEQVLARQQVQQLNQELTLTNREVQDTNVQLTRTNVDLDNFIYTASHDLKAPITNIEGLLLALEHELPEAGRVGDVPLMLTLMQQAVERFRRTIDHLTDLSRLQKEHNPASEAVALFPVVDAVRLDLVPLLTQTQGQLRVAIPEGLTVTFAEKNLRSVVYNLLSNAFKYHHPDRVPEVRLRSWLADEYTVLEVQDNGLGLDLSRGQEKLFAMFQRLHTHVEGTGVGLYMVKRIVENAGGRIEVTSQLGQGTTFTVSFPR